MKKKTNVITSWRLTAALLVASLAAYLSFTFGETPFSRWIDFLFHTIPGMALCLGLAVNLAAVTVRVIRNRTADDLAAERISAMDSWFRLSFSGSPDLGKLAAGVRAKGFSVTIGENSVCGIKGRFSFIPGTVMRTGLVVLLLSLLASSHFRETEKAVLATGGRADFFGTTVTLTGVEADLPSDFLQVGEENSFLLAHASAALSHAGGVCRITPGLPALVNGDYYRLVHIGYAQPVLMKSGKGTFYETMMLDILPPGKSQIAAVPGTGRFFTVSLEPVKTISKGLLKGRQYDLGKPFYRIVLQDSGARKPVAVAVGPGQRRSVDGTDLAFSHHALYAGIQAVHDPALAGVYSSVVITLLGMALMPARLFWFRKEMAVLTEGSGVLIGYSGEFFKKWGSRYFDQWKNELAESGKDLDTA